MNTDQNNLVRALRIVCVHLCASVILLLAAGCESSATRQARAGVADYMVGDYWSARQKLQPLSDKTNEDFVLNNVRLGSAALAAGDLQTAENAFLRAYEVQNAVGVNSGGRSLGATLVDEKIRVWKGEPFERAMTNFYLGLTYYMRQDYNNARAAFENALFKLREYSDDEKKPDQYAEAESNFTLGLVMLAKCWQRLGRDDLAKANFDRAVQLRPHLAALADYDWNDKSNLLLVIDYGYGPKKVTDGDGSIVGFGPTVAQAGPIPRPTVYLNNSPVPLGDLPQPPLDLLVLAQDRKWQSIDTIRVVKSAVGSGLLIAGAYNASRGGRGNAETGLAMMAAGLLLKATSQADTRSWEMLPRTVFLIPLRVPPGTHDLTVTFPDAFGLRQTWRGVPVPATGEATYYFRMQRYGVQERTWPPIVQPIGKQP